MDGLHRNLLSVYGGEAGVLSARALDELLEEVAAAAGQDVVRAAARFAEGMVQRHPFVDGSRRTAARGARMLLKLNGLQLERQALESFYELVWQLRGGTATEDDLVAALSSGLEAGEA